MATSHGQLLHENGLEVLPPAREYSGSIARAVKASRARGQPMSALHAAGLDFCAEEAAFRRSGNAEPSFGMVQPKRTVGIAFDRSASGRKLLKSVSPDKLAETMVHIRDRAQSAWRVFVPRVHREAVRDALARGQHFTDFGACLAGLNGK
ncbi:hypothetical protein GGX14DRAFT_405773 [Mycena pura]|uniref:Uncharacterized protein n=1 Tax=Mycena pura TaxID=153505 RepID=A0AAD6URN9_9AGAR|nr:hypothetical protein GGX14DRAFT_405773 [Mycena pura]